jgi:hypothetical protein
MNLIRIQQQELTLRLDPIILPRNTYLLYRHVYMQTYLQQTKNIMCAVRQQKLIYSMISVS